MCLMKTLAVNIALDLSVTLSHIELSSRLLKYMLHIHIRHIKNLACSVRGTFCRHVSKSNDESFWVF